MKAKFVTIETKESSLYTVRGVTKEMISDFSKSNHIISGKNGSYICSNNDGFTRLKAKKENGNIVNINIENILLKYVSANELPQIVADLNKKLAGTEFEMENSITIRGLDHIISEAIM